MTRKGKQPGGHIPLTYNEKRKLDYGTLSTRLETGSKKRFGDCSLSLAPATDPVATPSGHIYSREVILTYLLRKKKEQKSQKIQGEENRLKSLRLQSQNNSNKRIKLLQEFDSKNTSAARLSMEDHEHSLRMMTHKNVDTENKISRRKDLKRTSYWLSECLPEVDKEKTASDVSFNPSLLPRSEGVVSPMTGCPLRMKDLIPCCLMREEKLSKSDERKNVRRCVCALSQKVITTQPVVLIKKSGVVLLKDVYQSFVLEGKKKGTMECPITGIRFKYPKDILVLQKGTSGFSSSGEVLVKKYQPTLT